MAAFLGDLCSLWLWSVLGVPSPSQSRGLSPWAASSCLIAFAIIKNHLVIKNFQNKACGFPIPRVAGRPAGSPRADDKPHARRSKQLRQRKCGPGGGPGPVPTVTRPLWGSGGRQWQREGTRRGAPGLRGSRGCSSGLRACSWYRGASAHSDVCSSKLRAQVRLANEKSPVVAAAHTSH